MNKKAKSRVQRLIALFLSVLMVAGSIQYPVSAPVVEKDQTGNGYTITNKHQAIDPVKKEFTGKKS